MCQTCSLPGVLKTLFAGALGGWGHIPSDFQDTREAEPLTVTLQPSLQAVYRMFHLGRLGPLSHLPIIPQGTGSGHIS